MHKYLFFMSIALLSASTSVNVYASEKQNAKKVCSFKPKGSEEEKSASGMPPRTQITNNDTLRLIFGCTSAILTAVITKAYLNDTNPEWKS